MMKSTILKSIFTIFLSLTLMASAILHDTTNDIKVKATFEGYDEMGYNFSYKVKEIQSTLIFEEIKEEFIEKYDLEGETYVGKTFELKYAIIESTDDDSDEEILVLKSLKLLE